MKSNRRWICGGIVLLAGLSAWGFFAQAQVKAGGGTTELRKVDLQIVSFQAERTGLTATGDHRIRLSVVVRCAGDFAGSAGPFKVLCEGGDSAAGPFSPMGEASVASLGTGFGSVRSPTETRTFEDTVRSGALRHYRATVDSSRQVDESNETNNTRMTSYRADGCPGSDLILAQVEMIRSTRGSVLFHVWIRNRCLADCTGDLYYTVTPVSPAGAAVEQGIGPGLPGETNAGPLGTMAVEGRNGIALTFDVSIGVRGGTCTETSTSNNSLRVTIGADESRKTVTVPTIGTVWK